MPQTFYQIHNLVRRVATRDVRVRQPRRSRFNLLLGGGLVRVVRGRHATVAESVIRKLLPELIKREKKGELKVTTATGVRVDLLTLTPVETQAPTPPKPNPPLDNAKNDPPSAGAHVPTVEGGKAASEELRRPSVLENQIPEGVEEEVVISDPTVPSESGVEEPILAKEEKPSGSHQSSRSKRKKGR